MRICATIALIFLVGCAARPNHQKGGEASFSAPQLISQSIKQPENPEGVSKQHFEERKTIHHPDGIIEIIERRSKSEIGGSQDFAKIMREWARVDIMRKIGVSFLLFVIGFVMLTKGWPTPSLAFVAGGAASLLSLWWVGPLIAGAGLFAIFGYNARGAGE